MYILMMMYFIYYFLSMKFFSSFISCFLAFALFFWSVFATSWDLWSWMDNLSESISFWYAANQDITISQISSTKIVIASPKIQDDLGNDIKTYTVMYSQYPLSAILEDTSLLTQSKEKTFTFVSVTWTVYMELNVSQDTIDSTKIYYASVIPKDQAGVLWEISNEIRFSVSSLSFGEWLYTWSVHGVAGADMNLANVTHVVNGNQITLRWTAVNGSDKVDIFLWDPTTNAFTKLGTVNMSDERYTFTASRNGEFIINFMPNNGGREKRYTFTVAWVSGTPTTVKPIKTVPKVWPAENILVALFIAFVLYLLYRRNAAKNK